MDQETQEWYETMLDLYQHKGWELLQEQLQARVDSLKEQAYQVCDTNEKWQYARGQITTYSEILCMKGVTEASYDNLVEEADASNL